MLMVKHLLDHMSDTLGGGEVPTSLDAIGILNQAGEHLYSMHPWRFAQGRSALLNLRGEVSGTAASWTPGTLTLTDAGAFTNYAFLDRDEIQITNGTGVTTGFYVVASRTSANAIVLASSISSGTPTDVAYTLRPLSVALPDELRDIIAIESTESNCRRITLASLAEVLRARENVGVNDAHWYGAVSYVGSPPKPILEIGPGAGSNVTGAFRIFYRSRWAQLRTDSIAVDVPEFCESLLILLARAFARGYVREDQGTLSQRLAEIGAGPIFASAARSDGNVQPFFGTLRGGGPTIWRRSYPRDFVETVYRVNGPS